MKKTLFFIFIFFACTQVSFAQIPTQDNTNPFGVRQSTASQADSTQTNTATASLQTCSFTSSNTKAQDILDFMTCLISRSVIPLILGLSFLVFIWGVVQYIAGAQEEAKREKGRQFIIWGLIAITVMVSIYGIVKIFGDTFGIQSAGPKVETDAPPTPLDPGIPVDEEIPVA